MQTTSSKYTRPTWNYSAYPVKFVYDITNDKNANWLYATDHLFSKVY